MRIETLIVTINQTDDSLPKKMNIQTDAIIGNQCGKDGSYEFEYNGHKINIISSSTKGVGINRNEILMRTKADVCVLADDDMCFLENYEEIVRQWFAKIPKADILVFNLIGEKKRHKNSKVCRITRLNYGKYGAARVALRVRSVRFNSIMFNTLFGGGCEYSCGEDTLFLLECLKKGLKIYGIPVAIAQITDYNSSWFKGYTDKYFFDRGVLYYALYKKEAKILSLYHCIKHRKKYVSYGWKNALEQMKKGIDSVK